jgi:nuclear pore complex protein Nup54
MTSNALVPAQQQPNNFAFGSQQQQQLQNTSFQGMNSAQNAQLPDDSAIRELQSIKESYVAGPNNSRFKFQHLFLNVVKDPARRVKPNDIDELQWREAMRRAGGSDNAQNLWPVPYNGFNGLLERKSAQNDAVKEHKDRLEVLQKSVAALANRHETIVRVQMDAIKARHQELSRNLLKTLRYIDALEARFSRAVGYDKSTPKIVLQKLSEELRQMESLIAANSAQGLLGRVDSVASAARVQVGSARSGGQANGRADIDAESLDQAFNIMKDYADAIAKMDGAIHRNARDIQVIRSEI